MLKTSKKHHLAFEFPAAVVVVDHLAGHAAVDADVFAGNKAGLVAREVKHHVRDVERVADAAHPFTISNLAIFPCFLTCTCTGSCSFM